jgi:hypothetical protein
MGKKIHASEYRAMKIHIYYRHTLAGRTTMNMRPAWFSHELCFANLLQTLMADTQGTDIRLNVIFDGTEEDFASDFSSRHLASAPFAQSLVGRKAKVHIIRGGTQFAAWQKNLEIVARDFAGAADGDDLLYFLENDYLHQIDWIRHVNGLMQSPVEWGYLSLYDHGDKYSAAYPGLKSRIITTDTCHWRTTPSTCATFLTRKSTLERDHVLFSKYFHDRRTFWFITKILRRKLLTPVPGLSTHCMAGLLSPCIEWAAVAEQAKANVIGRSSPVSASG